MKVANAPQRARRWVRFSLRTTLILLTLVSVLLGTYVSKWRQEALDVAKFTGPEIRGKVELEPRFIGRVTPAFLQELIGKSLFQTVVSAICTICDDPLQPEDLRGSSKNPAASCLQEFPNLRSADLRFDHSNPSKATTSFKFLGQLEELAHLELHDAPSTTVAEITTHCKKLSSLTLYVSHPSTVTEIASNCQISSLEIVGGLDEQAIKAIAQNQHIRELRLGALTADADMIRQLRRVRSLRSFEIYSSVPESNSDGSFNFRPEIMHGGIPFIPKDLNEKSATVKSWLSAELPGVHVELSRWEADPPWKKELRLILESHAENAFSK